MSLFLLIMNNLIYFTKIFIKIKMKDRSVVKTISKVMIEKACRMLFCDQNISSISFVINISQRAVCEIRKKRRRKQSLIHSLYR